MAANLYDFLAKYLWIALIFATFVNGASWWLRGQPYRDEDPSLTSEYCTVISSFLVLLNIPWLIMGAGILFGGVPNVVYYLNPRFPTPFVTAFFGSLLVTWAIITYWILARGGAEQLVKLPGFIEPNTSVTVIKAAWSLAILIAVAGILWLYAKDIQPADL